MLLTQKIEEIACKYTDASGSIGKFLLKEKSKVENYSMQEIADYTFSSRPTLVRFAKKLGYSGWRDFLKAFLKEVKYLEPNILEVDFNVPFEKRDTTSSIIKKISKVKIDANLDTIELLDEAQLNNAVRILKDSNRIVMLGISINTIMAELFQHKMLRIGRSVELINQVDQAFMSYSLTKRDCVIVISYSANNIERLPISLLKSLKEHEVSIIGITSMGDNFIRAYSDATLTISSRENMYSKISSYATEESILLILDILYSCYFSLEYDKNMDYKLQMSSSIEIHRSSSLGSI